jgi:hypothetical protein
LKWSPHKGTDDAMTKQKGYKSGHRELTRVIRNGKEFLLYVTYVKNPVISYEIGKNGIVITNQQIIYIYYIPV